MTPQSNFTIEDGAYALDGGSIYLSFTDEDGNLHALVLAQHRIPMHESDHRTPGRLYLDDQVVEVRSKEETRLVAAIKIASISPTPSQRPASKEEPGPMLVVGEDIEDYMSAVEISQEAAISHLVQELVEFVESEDYVKLAKKYEQEGSTK